MLRTTVAGLRKSTVFEAFRLWLGGGQQQCTLWHSSAALSSSKKTSGGHDSASSSDSDSDGAVSDGVNRSLKEAVEGVARSVPTHGPALQSDLLKQLQSFAKLSRDQADGVSSSEAASKLSDLLSGMEVQKSIQRGKQPSADHQARTRNGQFQPRRQQSFADREKVTLFDGPALGIFTSKDTTGSPQGKETVAEAEAASPAKAEPSLWEKVQQEQVEVLSRRPPTNAFEEMIQWTQEGKLWQFPINNEQGMEEEMSTGFHQHVFLEEQIRDFPQRGPLRHFMELVVVGLARNPHLSVRQKHEHIHWFRRYFKEKEDVLREALGQDGLMAPANS